MKGLLGILGAMAFALAFVPQSAMAQGGECNGGLCGTPNQSGGGCGCGCGSVLVAMTDRGDTYQFADDFDGDGIEDEFDNCPFRSNYEQADADADMVGDACDVCINVADPTQSDIDADGFGDLCDDDMDGDTILNGADNCVSIPNVQQTDTDNDTFGNPCDDDDDGDGIFDIDDTCRLGGIGDVNDCDTDMDGDDFVENDNCPYVSNADQSDMDGDGIGDACDLDRDGDDIPNYVDNCIDVANPSQMDLDMDGLGDAGNWSNGAATCDTKECYVIGGDALNCLDPESAFSIYTTLVGERIEDKFQVGKDVTVALFSNRLGQMHSWTARFTELPADSDASLQNAKASGATTLENPQVTNCVETSGGTCTAMNNIEFEPDVPGKYVIKVTASLPQDDPLGPNTAAYTIVADVEGEPQGGCAATSGGFAALALGLLVIGWRRKR
jgi:hypothetical protein